VADDIKAWLSAAAYHKTSTIIVVDDKGQIGDERVIKLLNDLQNLPNDWVVTLAT